MKIGKIGLLIIMLSLLLALTNCRLRYELFSELPNKTLLKGAINDTTMLYMYKNRSSDGSSGYFFIDQGRAIANTNPFTAYPSGHLVLSLGDSILIESKIKGTGIKEYRIKLDSPDKTIFGGRNKINLRIIEVLQDDFKFTERYLDPITDSTTVIEDILYGKANGYYTSHKIEEVSNEGYSGIMDEILAVYKDSISRSNLKEQELYLDLHYPAEEINQKLPLIVYLHGGAFLFGDKQNELQELLVDELVRRGYILASVNYRLGTTLTGFGSVERIIYSGVQDTRAAIRYLVANAEKYRINTDHIYLCGSSAGGIIALTTAFMTEDSIFKRAGKRLFRPSMGGLDDSGNDLKAEVDIAGVISLWGALVDLDMIDNNPDTPTLLFHGTSDDIVRCDSGLPFRDVIGKTIHNLLESAWILHGSESIHKYMTNKEMSSQYIPFEGYGHEPHLDADGSQNDNSLVIREETRKYLFSNIAGSLPFEITGKDSISVNDHITAYRVYPDYYSNIKWEVEGGTIVRIFDNEVVEIVWHPEADSHLIRAYILDNAGIGFKKDMSITLQ